MQQHSSKAKNTVQMNRQQSNMLHFPSNLVESFGGGRESSVSFSSGPLFVMRLIFGGAL
jgi:hypothetical protein